MIDHLGLKVKDLDRSKAFYVKAFEPLGYGVVMEVGPEAAAADGHQPEGYRGVGFGKKGKPDFWIGTAPSGHGTSHVAFVAESRQAVDAFYKAALAAGGKDFGPPGVRAHYHPNYYGAFVLDFDGNNIEAVCHKPA